MCVFFFFHSFCLSGAGWVWEHATVGFSALLVLGLGVAQAGSCAFLFFFFSLLLFLWDLVCYGCLDGLGAVCGLTRYDCYCTYVRYLVLRRYQDLCVLMYYVKARM